ncbi:MAG: hypothetical protein ACKVJK_16795, partial [Methylophagaceae bacterium]
DSSIPLQFTSIRDAYSPTIGAITYQWQQTTDVAQTVWANIASETAINLNLTTALTQNTSFRRRAFSTLGAIVCDDIDNSVSNVIQITILDAVLTGNILANQQVCRILAAPLTVLAADLVNIVATGVETDRGPNDAVLYQWQLSVDNTIWYDVVTSSVSASTNILGGTATASFTANLNGNTLAAATITAAQQKADIDKYLAAQVDPDVQRIVYYRLKTTRVNDSNNDGALDVGEFNCEVFSAASQVIINSQPTLVQIVGPASVQTVCLGGPGIAPVTFQWGGSATGIRVINNAPGINSVTNNALKTVTLTGSPTTNGFLRVETLEALPDTCGIVRENYTINVVSAPSVPDYIQISDPNGVNPDVQIIADADGNIYNGQLYSCEIALNTPPALVTFSACYNNGRILGLTDSYRWYVTPASAGSINALTGVMSWTSGFFGDATISVAAVGCDGSETGQLDAVVTVNEFDATATQPTQPTPLLEAQIERIYFSQFPVTGERYSVFINGVEYFFVTTDLVFPFDSAVPPVVNGVDQTIPDIAAAIVSQINADNTSLVKDLLITVPARSSFVQGDVNSNGLADDVGAFIDITASYDGYSAPAIPPGGPRGYGGKLNFRSNVEPAPGNARAFGQIRSETIFETSKNICGTLTGAEPLCKTTATTPNTQYFSTSGFYSTISYTLDLSSIIPGSGSVGSPGIFVSSFTGEFNWNDGFHGTFNIESQAVGCDGIAFGTKGVR